MKRRSSRPRTFSFPQLIINLAILLVIPIIIGSVAYRAAVNSVEQSARRSHHAILDHAVDRWASKLASVRETMTAIATNPEIRRFAFLDNPYQTGQIYAAVEAMETFGELVLPDYMIEDVYVVYPSNGVVLGKDTAYRAARFYPWHLSYEGLTYEDWQEMLRSATGGMMVLPSRSVRFYETPGVDVVTIVSPFPFGLDDEAFLVFLMSTSAIVDLFGGIDLSGGGWVSIFNSRGEAVVRHGDRAVSYQELDVFALSPGTHQADLNGTPTLITNVIAESGDWSFVSAVPLRTVTRGLRRVQRVTLFVILTILAVGVAAAALIGYRLLQPVRFLSENKEALERELEAQNPLLISSFFEKLLRGEFAAESEIEAYMSHLVLDLHMRWYCVAMASLSEAGTLSMWGAAGDQKANRLILSDAVRRTSDPDSVYVHNVDTHRLAVIVGGETESYADARKRAREIIERGMRAVPVPIARLCSWGVGTPYRALIEIFHSAREASLTLDYGEMHERGGVVFYEDIPRRRSGYSYPPEVENRVMSLARSGGVDELKSVLDGLQQENIDSRHPSSLAVRLFADNLLCTVMKLLDTNVIKEEAPAATTEQQIEAAAEELSPHRRHCLARKLLLEVAEATNCRKQSHNSTLAQQIVHYVHQYFADPNLTRTSIADKFGISEPYLSQFFKEQTGETLGTYIQGLRMKQARKLLADPKTPVKDVYQNVGYSAYTTFARAFKRVYGISATNYRESLERAT